MTGVKTTRTSCKVSKVEPEHTLQNIAGSLDPREMFVALRGIVFSSYLATNTEKSSLNLLFLVDPWNKNQDAKWCCGTGYRRPWWRGLSHQLAHRLLQTLSNCHNLCLVFLATCQSYMITSVMFCNTLTSTRCSPAVLVTLTSGLSVWTALLGQPEAMNLKTKRFFLYFEKSVQFFPFGVF